MELKQILARQPGPEVAEQLSMYQSTAKEKTKQMKVNKINLCFFYQFRLYLCSLSIIFLISTIHLLQRNPPENLIESLNCSFSPFLNFSCQPIRDVSSISTNFRGHFKFSFVSNCHIEAPRAKFVAKDYLMSSTLLKLISNAILQPADIDV